MTSPTMTVPSLTIPAPALAIPAPAVSAPARTYTNPVYAGDFPDPFVLRVGNEYYAYATNAERRNVQTLRLAPDFSSYKYLGDALPRLPDWAARRRTLTWAPAVLPVGGRFVLYYTTRFRKSGKQSISRAVSDHPAGPFRDDSSRPFISQADLGGAIDPSPFVDDDGQAYLLWKNDGNSCKRQTGIWIQKLSEDGLSLAGQAVELIQRDLHWEYPLIEGPSMVKHDGKYYLFYSANWWEGRNYAVGYAVSDSLTGPYTKPLKQPFFARRGNIMGPGGQEFVTDPSGNLWMAYHAWTSPYVGYPRGKRSLRMERVNFVDGMPVVGGPTDEAQPLA